MSDAFAAMPIRYLDGAAPATPLPKRPRLVQPVTDDAIPTSLLLAALSTALDLTEGQLPGHALRTCYLAVRLAERLALPSRDRETIFHAAFLKDAGCSSNAAAISRIFGVDEIALKGRQSTLDRSVLAYAAFTIQSLPQTEPLPRRLRRLIAIALRGSRERRAVEQLRCERGAGIARKAGFDDAVADAIAAVHESWDGGGQPAGLRGTAIPLAARIITLCAGLDVFRSTRSRATAVATVRERRGTWYEPALVDELLVAIDAGLIDDLEAPDLVGRTAELEPAGLVRLSDEADVDRIAEAFADVVDAKSPYTGSHSRRVGDLAPTLAVALGLGADVVRDVRRAGLLHDLGKLGVPNVILDKPGALDATELQLIQRHPELTVRILEPVPLFASVAELAGAHHERLDGRGYFRGLRAPEIGAGARVVAVADVFEALTAERPYRAAMSTEQALAVLDAETGDHLAAEAVEALRRTLP